MSNRPTIAYQPALDGVRAFAVVAVLLFHAGVPGFSGGYLGVSVFFTLSGFLITSLLLEEHRTTGHIDLVGFYARRLRRLLPASVLCLIGVALIGTFTDLFDGVAGLRTHVLGAVFQVANWVFLAGDGSYQDLLARTSGTSSPLEHFWSLAIEEQFYWVWPPTMMLVLGRASRHRDRLLIIGSVVVATSIAAPVIALVWGPDAAYWATPARISEILMGALLALILTRRSVPSAVGWLAPLALAVLSLCIVLFPSSGGPAYRGALPLVAVVSACLVLGLHAPSSVRRVLEIDGVVWVGKVSYGLYLFHWPVFVLIDADRFDWPSPVLFAVRMVVTLGVTVASYDLIERPIRTDRRLGSRLTFAMAALSTATVFVVAVTVVPKEIGEYWNPDRDVAEAAAIDVTDGPLVSLVVPTTVAPAATTAAPTTSNVTNVPTTTEPADPAAAVSSSVPADEQSVDEVAGAGVVAPPPLPDLARPVRIVVTGDSTAKAFGTGLVTWAADHPDLAQVEVVSAPGCGFLTGGERGSGDKIVPIEGCDDWVEEFLYPAVDRLQPDVVMAMVTSWDLLDRRWDSAALLTPFDDEYADRLERDYRELTQQLEAHGAAEVALVRQPIPDAFWLPVVDAQEEPARHAVIYGIYERIAASDDRVSVVALDGWFDQQGLDRSQAVRPDGIHPTPEAATEISEDFLGEQLVRIALGVRR